MAGTTHDDARAIVNALQQLNTTILSGAGLATEATVAAILAKDTLIEVDTETINLSVDGLEALATTGNTNTGNSATSLAIMDDWDESDRAKVNLIVGQAGIAAGTGVDGVTVPRVTLATDVPLPAGTNNIGDVDIVSGTITTVSTVTAVTSITNAVSTKETPDATATFAPDSDISTALEASSVSKASAGVFYGLSGHNTLASAQWILVFNSASIPANGAVTPIIALRVAANSNFTLDTGKFGIYCSAGISWCNSTDATIFNKTLGAADCFVNVQYK